MIKPKAMWLWHRFWFF